MNKPGTSTARGRLAALMVVAALAATARRLRRRRRCPRPDKGAFDTGRIKPGATALVKLTKRGTYVFHCTIHPFMTGKVIVE